jgi:hypothetical protein
MTEQTDPAWILQQAFNALPADLKAYAGLPLEQQLKAIWVAINAQRVEQDRKNRELHNLGITAFNSGIR